MALSASTCLLGGVEPLQLNIGDTAVISGNADVRTYGIALTLGGERNQQFFSLLPNIQHNNTIISSQRHCDTGAPSCIAQSGGVYTYTSGDTAVTTNSINRWNGTEGEDVGDDGYYSAFVYFNDVASVDGGTVYGLPFATPNNYSDESQGSIGFGRNSIFLENALQSEIVPNKQFSYWPGNWHSSYSVEDGLIVVGGYDAGRMATDSKFQSFELADDADAVMQLELESFEWEADPGNLTSLIPGNDGPWHAKLHNTYEFLDVPYEAYFNFATANNGTLNETTSVYSYDNVVEYGNIIITIAGGLKINISAYDLMYYRSRYNDEGELEDDDSRPNLASRISAYPGTEEVPLWFGLPFLTSVLLVVDYDDGHFHLANANQSTIKPDIKSLCTGGPTSYINTRNDTIADDDHHKNHTKVAAIAGGVGGGIGGLLVIGAIVAFFLVRRRRKHRQQQQAISQEPYKSAVDNEPSDKYMEATVYDVHDNAFDREYEQRYGSPPPERQRHVTSPSELASPQISSKSQTNSHLSDGGVGSSTTATDGRGEEKHEMASNEKLTATSGPVEMPSDFDHRWR